ncbi:MAG: CtsR family transcriptional regulator [Bacillota bacterium]|nr:CtsR family transcriptional regulator [Bacillota bacterium]
MSTLANQIEEYLKKLLSLSETGILELKRSDLAEIFMCVPSQINYVLDTRFSANQGYMIESRRGGGGYLRIVKLAMDTEPNLVGMIKQAKDARISRQSGEKLIDRLYEEGFLSSREAMLVRNLTDDAVLKKAGDAELLRGELLNTVLLLLLREDFSERS